jgi:hypothetical protein
MAIPIARAKEWPFFVRPSMTLKIINIPFIRAPRKISHFARQIGGQSSCGNAFRGTASMDLGIFRGAH